MNKSRITTIMRTGTLSVVLSIIFYFLLFDPISDIRIKYTLLFLLVLVISSFLLLFKGNVRNEDELQKQMRLEIYAKTYRLQAFIFLIFFIALNLFEWKFSALILITSYFLANNLMMLVVMTAVKKKYM